MKNSQLHLLFAIVSMIVLVALSNYLVEFPLNQWLTYGAFTYPFTFFITELTNFHYGAKRARLVVYAGFIFAVGLTFLWMNPRIAMASSIAFLVSQLLDVSIFNRLRRAVWWLAPALSSFLACTVDTTIFFFLAFGSGQWLSLALGDLLVKLAVDLMLLLPFRMMLRQKPKILPLSI